jgi:hypothetical protein
MVKGSANIRGIRNYRKCPQSGNVCPCKQLHKSKGFKD